MKTHLAFFAAVWLAVAVRGEAPASAAGVYRCSSGIETRTITLLTNGNYLARWDADIGTNGFASGTWAVVGSEVRLTPQNEEGPMMKGHFRLLLLRDFKGRRALLRKEDEKYSDNDLFHLFLQNQPNHSLDSTTSAGTSAAEQPRVPASVESHL